MGMNDRVQVNVNGCIVETDPHMALLLSETAEDDDRPYYHEPSYGDKGCVDPQTGRPGVIEDVDPEVGLLVCNYCGQGF